MSKVFNMVGGGGGPAASIFVTGLSETDTVTATKGAKTLTGKWTQGPNPAVHGLPDGYTELEYIESTGTQYINTNKVNISGVDVTFQGGTNGQLVYGVELSSNNRNALFLNDGNYISLCNWDLTLGSIDSEWHTFKANCNGDEKIIFDGVEKGSIGTGCVVNLAMTIFAFNSNGTIKQYFTGKISHFKAYNNAKVALNMHPCIRTSDNAIGMYDLVSNTFFTNSGSGDFVAGPEIPKYIDGHIIKPIRDFGTWTVTATDGTNTDTQDVLVDVITEYVIEMSYKLYLYRNGDECEDVTGGWTNNGYLADSSNTRSVTRYDDSFYFDEYLECAGTVNSIDLSPWSKLCAEITHTSGTEVAQPWVGYSAIKNLSGSMGRVSAGCSASGTEIVSLDISSVNGSNYVMCALTDRKQTGYVHKVWLE